MGIYAPAAHSRTSNTDTKLLIYGLFQKGRVLAQDGVNTEDLPTSSGHPFFERLNRILGESGFDAFVEGLCAAFYADRLGRPSLRPGCQPIFLRYNPGSQSQRKAAKGTVKLRS